MVQMERIPVTGDAVRVDPHLHPNCLPVGLKANWQYYIDRMDRLEAIQHRDDCPGCKGGCSGYKTSLKLRVHLKGDPPGTTWPINFFVLFYP